MRLPKGKGPKLPPKPRGGGAAARQDQYARERGLRDAHPSADAEDQTAADDQTEESEETEGREDQEP
ncbi:MAG TPA: hypothetical protein VIP46_01025 [Pyrinomonadaceae bacterium]